MIVVVDASVALKWFFRARDDEDDVDRAIAMLEAIDAGSVHMRQPPHFLAEVAAVLAREKPDDAHEDLRDLQLLDWEFEDGPDLYSTAVDLGVRLGQHVFDTLYHATALRLEGATLVTADARYYDVARGEGRVELLDGFSAAG